MNMYGFDAQDAGTVVWPKFVALITSIRNTGGIKYDDFAPPAYTVVNHTLLPFLENCEKCMALSNGTVDAGLKIHDAAPMVAKFKSLAFEKQDFKDLKV